MCLKASSGNNFLPLAGNGVKAIIPVKKLATSASELPVADLEPKDSLNRENLKNGLAVKIPVNKKIPANIFSVSSSLTQNILPASPQVSVISPKDRETFNNLFSALGGDFSERYSGRESLIALSIVHKDNLRNVASDPQKIELLRILTIHLDEAKSKDPALYKSIVQGIDKIIMDFKSAGKTDKLMDYVFIEMASTGSLTSAISDWGARKIVQSNSLLENTNINQKVDLLNTLSRVYTNDEEQKAIIKIMQSSSGKGDFKSLLAGWSDNLNMTKASFDVLYNKMSGENSTNFLQTFREGIKKEGISTEVIKELYGASSILTDLNKLEQAEKLEKDGKYSDSSSLYSEIGDNKKARQLLEMSGYDFYRKGNYSGLVKDFLNYSYSGLKESLNDGVSSVEKGLSLNWARSLATSSAEKIDKTLKDFPVLQAKNVINLKEQREANLEKLNSLAPKNLSPAQKENHNKVFERKIDILTGTKAHSGNDIKLLLDASEAHERLMNRITNAKESIYIEVYLFYNDKRGNEVADALIKKANEGVDVRVVVDGLSNTANYPVLKKLKNSKVKFETYAGSFTDPLTNRGMVGYHRKLYIFDKKSAMTGGINIGDNYLQKGKWHDLLVEVKGPVMSDTLNNFYKMWSFSSSTLPEKAPPPEHFKNDLTKSDERFPFDTNGSVRLITTDPESGDKDIRTWMLEAIKSAHTRVMIQDPYFNDPDIVEALKGAVARKVKVDVIFPNSNDVAIMKHLDDNVLDALYSAGADVHYYNTNGKESFNHLKATVVDDLVSLGSSNKDVRAMNTNQEINYVINDPKFTDIVVKRVFEADLKKSVPAKPVVDDIPRRLIKLALSEFPSLF